MFIYEFTAGIQEIVEVPEEEVVETEYDPHHHRKIRHPTTYMETMIHMLKGSIGAGVLAMPYAMSRVGLALGLVGLPAIVVFAGCCLQMLINSQYRWCKREKKSYINYPKCMRIAVLGGPKFLQKYANYFQYLTDAILISWQLAICVIYFVFVADNVKLICDYYTLNFSVRVHLCFLFIPMLLLNMIKDLKMMTPLSLVSNVIQTLSMLLLIFYLVEDDYVVSPEMFTVMSPMALAQFIAITLFALEAVGVILALEYNMQQPKQFSGACGLMSRGMMVIFCLYMVVGLGGFLKYGHAVKPAVTLNLPEDQKKAQAARLGMALAIFLSFPLQNYVAYAILWIKIRKKLQIKSKSAKFIKMSDYGLRISLVVLPFVVAIASPTLGPFIELAGAFCLSLLAVVFPALMDICERHPARYGLCHNKLLRDVVVIVLGMVALVAGVVVALMQIIFPGEH